MMCSMVTSYSLARTILTITKSPLGPRIIIITALMPVRPFTRTHIRPNGQKIVHRVLWRILENETD